MIYAVAAAGDHKLAIKAYKRIQKYSIITNINYIQSYNT